MYIKFSKWKICTFSSRHRLSPVLAPEIIKLVCTCGVKDYGPFIFNWWICFNYQVVLHLEWQEATFLTEISLHHHNWILIRLLFMQDYETQKHGFPVQVINIHGYKWIYSIRGIWLVLLHKASMVHLLSCIMWVIVMLKKTGWTILFKEK